MNSDDGVILKSLIAESKDGEWGKGEPSEESTEMIVIRGTDFDDVRIGSFATVPRRFIPNRIAARKTLGANDIIIETAGGSKGRPTGRTLFIKSSTLSRSPLPATCASFSRFIRIDSERANPHYVFWTLQCLHASGHMLAYHTQHTGVARFQFTTFSTTEKLPLPPRPEQDRIADILSAYDDLIENNTRRIRILEEMAAAVYREWFVHFRFPGHEKVRMVDSPLGKVPKGWRVGTLGDVAGEVRRSVDPTEVDPTTPYCGLEHLPRKSITLGEWGFAQDVQSTKLAFRKGEILFGKIRPYFHKVAVAPVDGVSSSDAIVIVPKCEQVFGLVTCCVSSDEFVGNATQTSQGTKMPRANWDVLLKYPLVIPPENLLSQFDGIIRSLVLLSQNLMFRNRNLRQTRDLLLPRLISGEVDVSKLDLAKEAT